MARDNLTGRQERFCQEFVASGNAYQSAINAGYSEAYSKGNIKYLLENERINNRLQELYAARDSQLIADGDELKKTLTAIIRQQMTEEMIVVESMGDGYSEARSMDKHPAFKDMLKAIELLGKMGGMFTDKVNLEGTVPIVLKGYDDVKD